MRILRWGTQRILRYKVSVDGFHWPVDGSLRKLLSWLQFSHLFEQSLPDNRHVKTCRLYGEQALSALRSQVLCGETISTLRFNVESKRKVLIFTFSLTLLSQVGCFTGKSICWRQKVSLPFRFLILGELFLCKSALCHFSYWPLTGCCVIGQSQALYVNYSINKLIP